MTDSTAHDRRESLGGNLDRLAERAGGVLSRARLTVRVRQVLSRTVSLLCLFALPGLLFELLRFLAGYAAPGLRWWQHAALVLAFASVFAAGWLWRDYRSHRFARGATLGLFDRQLGLANRLATADEFIVAPGRSGFMAAAIDDAVEPAERAMHSQAQPIHVDRQWHLSRWSLASVPGTAGLLLLTTWLGGLELANAGAEPGSPASGASSPDLAVIGTVTENPAGETGMRSAAEPLRLARSDADTGNTASADAPESEAGHVAANPSGRSAQQQGGDRRSTSSQSGGMPSGAASRPQAAASGQQAARSKPSASGQQDRQSAAEPQAASGERQAASATDTSSPAGESGSSDSPGDSGQSGDDGQDGGAGAESAQAQAGQGEGEQSDSQSGAGQGEEDDQRGEGEQSNEGAGEGQRTAEGESQNSGESGGEPDARAERQSQGEGGQPDFGQQSAEGTGEGRSSGEDAIKKNRGAAKAMLALPTADRLIGRRGEGPEQTRQEQSLPLAEQVAPVPAGARPQRGDRIGTLQHARVSGWSRDLVMSYFDRPHDEAAGGKTESANTNTNTNTNTNAGNGQGD